MMPEDLPRGADPADIAARVVPKRLLLATDLSCRCDRALDRAASLAREWQAKLLIAHALESPRMGLESPVWRQPASAQQVALQRVYTDMHDAAGVELEVIVERRDPVSLIRDTCEQSGCDLIITGVAREETLGRMVLGTTVTALVSQTTVPILVVKSRARGPYRNVVVATDFSVASLRALELALDLLPRANVSLFHAYRAAFEQYLDDPMVARDAEETLALEEAGRFLARSPIVAASGRTVPVLAACGDVRPLLCDLVQTRPIDLVVLGTRARRGLLRALLGSVADRALEALPCDVLLVPAH